MANKVRIDLMVEESTKEYLKRFAAERVISMSEMVDRLIVEHLGRMGQDYPRAPHPSDAVFDMMWIQELKGWVEGAIGCGKVYSFDDFLVRFRTDDERSEARDGAILYVPTDSPFYGIIVADCVVEADHNDVISSFGGDGKGILKTVDAYLSWYQNEDGMHLYGLCIVPKGGDPKSVEQSISDWESPSSWPEGIPEPTNGGA